jgi:hypothetical protein
MSTLSSSTLRQARPSGVLQSCYNRATVLRGKFQKTCIRNRGHRQKRQKIFKNQLQALFFSF